MATTGAPPGEPGEVKLGRFWEGVSEQSWERVSERSGERLRAEGRPAGRPEASGRRWWPSGKAGAGAPAAATGRSWYSWAGRRPSGMRRVDRAGGGVGEGVGGETLVGAGEEDLKRLGSGGEGARAGAPGRCQAGGRRWVGWRRIGAWIAPGSVPCEKTGGRADAWDRGDAGGELGGVGAAADRSWWRCPSKTVAPCEEAGGIRRECVLRRIAVGHDGRGLREGRWYSQQECLQE